MRLVDGSRAEAPAVLLDAPTPQIRTKVFVAPSDRLRADSPPSRCLRAARDHAPTGPLVSRIGASGLSVTFRTASGRALVACDGISPAGGPWCGRAYGRLDRGRLRDPRLDLACTSASGAPVAFAWFEPGADASFVAVRQAGYVEVYRVAGGAPVRISTTTGISASDSTAAVEVSEHDRRGAFLRASILEARVAG
jgi:hypothetical protein